MVKVVDKARNDYNQGSTTSSLGRDGSPGSGAGGGRKSIRSRSRSRDRTSRRRRERTRSRTRSRSPVYSSRRLRKRSDEGSKGDPGGGDHFGRRNRGPSSDRRDSYASHGGPPVQRISDKTGTNERSVPYYERYPPSALNPPTQPDHRVPSSKPIAESSAYTRNPDSVADTIQPARNFTNPWLNPSREPPIANNGGLLPVPPGTYPASMGSIRAPLRPTQDQDRQQPIFGANGHQIPEQTQNSGYNATFGSSSNRETPPDFGGAMRARLQPPPQVQQEPPPGQPQDRQNGQQPFQERPNADHSREPNKPDESPIPGEYDRGGYKGSIMDVYSNPPRFHERVHSGGGAPGGVGPPPGNQRALEVPSQNASGGYSASFDSTPSSSKLHSLPKSSPQRPPGPMGPPADTNPAYQSGIQNRPPIESSGPPFQYENAVRPPPIRPVVRRSRAPLLASPPVPLEPEPRAFGNGQPPHPHPPPPPHLMRHPRPPMPDGTRDSLLNLPPPERMIRPPLFPPRMPGPNEVSEMELLPKGNVSKPISLFSSIVRPGAPEDPPGSDMCTTPFLRFRNLPPPLLEYNGIRELCRPVHIRGRNNIKIVYDSEGRKTGEVLVQFNDKDDAGTVMQKLRGEPFQMESINEGSFDDGVDGPLDVGGGRGNACVAPTLSGLYPRFPNSSPPGDGTRPPMDQRGPRPPLSDPNCQPFIVLIYNMPYRMCKADIMDFLYKSGIRTSEDVLQIAVEVGRMNRRPTGRAYIEVTGRPVMEAILALNGQDFGGRKAFFSPSDLEAMENSTGARSCKKLSSPIPPPNNNLFMGGGGPPPMPPTNQPPPMPMDVGDNVGNVSLNSSLNTSTSQALIIADSSPLGGRGAPAPLREETCIHMTGLPHGVTEKDILTFFEGFRIIPGGTGIRLMCEPPGSAYVEFSLPGEVARALKKNREFIGTRPVSIRACSKQELNDAVQHQFVSSATTTTTTRSFASVPIAQSNNVLPSAAHSIQQVEPCIQQVTPMYQPPTGMIPSLAASAPRIDPRRIASVQKEPEKVEMESPASPGTTIAQSQTPPAVSVPSGGPGAANPSISVSRRPPIDANVIKSIGPIGTVLVMHHLPSSITLEEICDLYAGFNVLDDSVRMHYNQTGEPTGDCLLAVSTSEEAKKAAFKLNGTILGGNALEVYVATVA